MAKRQVSKRASPPRKKARASSCCAKREFASDCQIKSRTPWRVKLEKKQQRKIVPMPRKMMARLGPGKLLIPTPLDVDEEIRRSHAGELLTARVIRARLADRFGADTTCPLCTGIFTRIAAETAAEDEREGRADVTPYWRVVGENGELNPKFPGGLAVQARRLLEEGHRITLRHGKKPRVAERTATSVGILVCE